jgi:hypothetical protein
MNMRQRKRAHHRAVIAWAQRRYNWCGPFRALEYMANYQRMMAHDRIMRAKWAAEDHSGDEPF